MIKLNVDTDVYLELSLNPGINVLEEEKTVSIQNPQIRSQIGNVNIKQESLHVRSLIPCIIQGALAEGWVGGKRERGLANTRRAMTEIKNKIKNIIWKRKNNHDI